MGLIVRSRGQVVVSYTFDRYNKAMRPYLAFVKGRGLEDAASYLRDLAYERMYKVFHATDKGTKPDRKSRRRRKTLEETLFPFAPGATNYPPLEKQGKYGFKIKLINDLSHVNDSLSFTSARGKRFSRLKIAEFGHAGVTDNQAFRVFYHQTKKKYNVGKFGSGGTNKFLMNIKERDALRMHKTLIERLKVHHAPASGRFFIKAGMTFLKTQGSKTVLSYIRERLK